MMASTGDGLAGTPPSYVGTSTPHDTVRIVGEMLQDRRLLFGLIGAGIVAYLPELASPTFATDYFFDIGFISSKFYAFTIDGRYLAELIRNISGRMFPPTLLMIIGVVLLMLSGLLCCVMLGVRRWLPALIACTMFATFPLLFETFAYHAIRHIVPLGFVLSIMAVLHGGLGRRLGPSLLSVGGIYLALMLYQSTIYIAAIMTLFAAGLRLLEGEKPLANLSRYILPRAAAMVLALVLYSLTVRFAGPYFGASADRLQEVPLVANVGELEQTAELILATLREFFWDDIFLFPVTAKWAFLAIALVGAGCTISRPGRQDLVGSICALCLFLISPLLAFGAAWLVKMPIAMMNDRILISFVAVYAGGFLVAWSIAGRSRNVVAGLGMLIASIFVYQANVWHQYMDLKNRADIDIASEISETIKAQPGYRPWLPLVLIGTNKAAAYQPFRAFPIARQHLGNSSLVSAFADAWSASRLLIFYFPFAGASPADTARMTELTAGLPVWPDPRSVLVAEDKIAVVLGR